MHQLIVTLDTKDQAKAVSAYLRTLQGVTSVLDKEISPLKSTDWIRPGRPATNDELEQMINECENDIEAGNTMNVEEAMHLTAKKMDEWNRTNRK